MVPDRNDRFSLDRGLRYRHCNQGYGNKVGVDRNRDFMMQRLLVSFAILAVLSTNAYAVPAVWGTTYGPGGVSSTPTTVVFTSAGSGTFTVPTNWNSSLIGSNPYANKIECVGAGVAGQNLGSPGTSSGGDGAKYAAVTNIVFTPGASISYTIAVLNSSHGSAGGDSYFNGASCAAASVCAPGGDSSSTAVGSTVSIGGSSAAASGGGGGGGAGGPNGAGNNASGSTGGSGDAGAGGSGGAASFNGGTGIEWGVTGIGSGGGGGGDHAASGGGSGGLYGAGGGGAVNSDGGGSGQQGACAITYYGLL
jgi:hypothetical protein